MKNKKLIIVLSIFFLLWSLMVMNGYTKQFDLVIYEFLISFKSRYVTMFMCFISNTSRAFTIICMILIAFILHRKIGLLLFGNAFGNAFLNQGLKWLFKRQRPLFTHLQKVSGYSFPSGHTMIALSFYGFLYYLACLYIKDLKKRNIVCLLLGILILLVGISRIYLGVHFASDVVAGYLMSAIYLLVYIEIIEKYV